MKQILLIIGLIVVVGYTSFTQPPSWENEITLSTAITGATSAVSDGYGQHLVGVYSSVVKHFLVGNDGVIIYNTLSVSGGEYPVVTSYGGKVRVTMKVGNEVKIYQSTNGGSTWPTILNYTPNPVVPIYSLDSYSDVIGTHIVWENNPDDQKNHEIYYVRYDDRISNWQSFKNVTDLSSPAAGGRPSVTATSNKAHVGFAGANYQLTTRDLNLTTHVWDANYKTESSTDHPIAISNLASIGDYVYSVSVSDLIVGGGCSRVYFYTSRHADDASWQYQFPLGGACVGDVGGQRYIQTNSGTLWFLQKSDYLYLRSYIPGIGWYDYEQVTQTSNPSSHHISASQFGIYCFWEYLEINGITYSMMRRKPTTVTGSFTQNAFLTGNNWLSGSSIGVPSGKTVEARSGSYTNIMANSVFSYEGTFNLNSGSTLNMFEGSRINFGYGKALTVNGIINAQGSPSSRITIASTSKYKGSWAKIQLNGGPNTLRYCNVKYANMGIVLNSTSTNTIEYCTVDSSLNFGIQNIGTSRVQGVCNINYTTISNCNNGLVVYNGRADVSNCTFQGNSQGSSVNNGLVYLFNTYIQNNTSRGAYISGSNSYYYLCPSTFAYGNNSFLHNLLQQLYIVSSGWAYLGSYDAVKGIQYGGSNILRNDGNGWGNLINHGGRDCISAQRNCWITGSTNGIVGCVDTSYSLNCQTMQSQFISGSSPTEENMLDLVSELKQSVENNSGDAPNALRQLSALVGPGGDYQKELGISWEEFLSKLIESKYASDNLKTIAASHALYNLVNNQEFDKVILKSKSMLTGNPNEELKLTCMISQVVAFVNISDFDQAIKVLEQIEKELTNIDPEALDMWKMYVQEAQSDRLTQTTKRASIKDVEHQLPASFMLYQNYPNPFNPSTFIRYSLLEQQHVKLTIYDILGREIKTLVDEIQPEGYKEVEFNASASGGLASGVYFFRIHAGPFTDIKKMIFAR